MDELLAAAAEAMGVPPAMVERSAEARAKASGKSVEEVLRAWAGGGAVESEPPDADEVPADTVPEEAAAEPTPPPDGVGADDEEAPAAQAGAMDRNAMISAAADKLRMPESMVRRSVAARSKESGRSEDEILREWVGAESDAVPAPGSVTPAPPPVETPEAATPAVTEEPEPGPSAEAAEAPAAGPGDEDELLSAAAEKMGMPESMVKRSAEARSKAQDVPVTSVLAEWAGVEAPAAAEAAPAEAAPAEAAEAAEPAAEAAKPAEEAPVAVPEPEEPDVEVLGETEPVEPEPVAKRPSREDELEPEEEAVAAGALPRWLAALFVFVPAFAIAYALFLPNGPNCGDAGRLAVDPVSGVAVNCDFSEFGEEVADYFAIGEEVYAGIGCVACHGAGGGGVASFPAFTGGELLSTFPEGSCDAQIEWISLGTSGWPEPTYGANEKPVGGSGAVMPGFANTLDDEELAAVALYERVAFGGQDLEAALADCGFAEGGADGEVAAGE